LLAWTVALLVRLEWYAAFFAFLVSAVGAYGAYRAAGGRHNRQLAKAAWEARHHIDVVSDPVASWPAKVNAMFDMLEQDSGGNYAAALANLKLLSLPPRVQVAYNEALRDPSAETWNKLRQALVESPPVRDA